MTSTSPQPSQPCQQPAALTRLLQWRLLWQLCLRSLTLVAVTLIALLSATVAIGQASSSFDLACRSIMTAGGNVSTGDNFAVIAALGLPMVPVQDSNTAPTYAVRSADYGVRAGFLPGYPKSPSPTVADPLPPDLEYVQRLPVLFKALYIVRGGC